MSTFPSAPDALALFAQCLKTVPDPRSKQGTSHPYSTLLAIRRQVQRSFLPLHRR
ncbi:MAG: hypothetical protein FWE95_06270 [Planctomycetaceae bacterium]|nr:hypothetical protein [Planctomycetaceae bacterium]